MRKVYISHMESPIGSLTISSSELGLCGIWFEKSEDLNIWLHKHFDIVEESNEYNINIMNQINRYFNKDLKYFNINLDLIGTNFQKNVWNELLKIEYGKTVSYKDVACNIGNCKGARGVGSAVGANNIPILIPCHRVIGNNRKLTGFSGGIEKKIKLLELEGFEIDNGSVREKNKGLD